MSLKQKPAPEINFEFLPVDMSTPIFSGEKCTPIFSGEKQQIKMNINLPIKIKKSENNFNIPLFDQKPNNLLTEPNSPRKSNFMNLRKICQNNDYESRRVNTQQNSPKSKESQNLQRKKYIKNKNSTQMSDILKELDQ